MGWSYDDHDIAHYNNKRTNTFYCKYMMNYNSTNNRYVAELQHFHYSEDGKIAVVACLYKKGKSDSFHTEVCM